MLALALAFVAFRPAPTQGPFARDFEAYYAAGATWNAGGDPYSRAVWQVERTIDGVDPARDELLPYVGPAAALPLFGALAHLPHAVAVRVWTALLAGALAAVVLAAFALTGVPRRDGILGALVFAIAASPTISDIALGQIALLAAAGIACALVAYAQRTNGATFAGGALATLLAGAQPNVALALIARVRDARAAVPAALGAAAFGALTLAAGGGPGGFAAYLQRLGAHARAERFAAIQHTPAAIAYALGAPVQFATVLGVLVALAAIAVTVVVTVRARLDAQDGTLLALAALPLAIPFFHEHDFIIELIPLLVLALCARGSARVFAGVASILVFVDWFGLAQREGAQVQIIAFGFAVACAFVSLGTAPRILRRDLVPLATLLVLAAIAVPFAQRAPAPVWPDALPDGYRAPTQADASAVWADEQRVAGLDAAVPTWGALRALPLVGCVLIGVAVVLRGRRRSNAESAVAPR